MDEGAQDDSSIGDPFADAESGADASSSFAQWPFRKGAAPKPRPPVKGNAFQEQIEAMKRKRQIEADL